MLVTLGVNQAITANQSATLTYSPNSVQEIHIKLEDADWEDSRITIQIGSRTIVNGILSYGLSGLTALTSNGVQSASQGFLKIDVGSWECTRMDNLYVTITAGSADLTGVDVSAIVDEPRMAQPLKLTAYTDNTFTSPNNLYAISFDTARASVANDDYNIEIRNRLESSAPNLISANSYFASLAVGFNDGAYTNGFGFLNKNAVPMSTTYNYPSSAVTDTIITCEAVGTTPQQRAQAKDSKAMALASIGR